MEFNVSPQAAEMLGTMNVASSYYDESPFHHWVLDGIFPMRRMKEIVQAFPKLNDNARCWVNYDNENEKKRTFNERGAMPEPIAEMFDELLSEKFAEQLGDVTGIRGLIPDHSLYGGGVHAMSRKDYLQVHLDHSHNPNGMGRVLTLIMFLNVVWLKDWGGALQLWSSVPVMPVKHILPAPGRIALLTNEWNSYHGVEEVLCPAGEQRITLAVYYLGQHPEGMPPRPKALFLPRR